jgi:glucosylceramidase
VLASQVENGEIMAAAVRNPDGTLAVAVFNESEEKVGYALDIDGTVHTLHIPPQALQTILIEPKQ